MTNLTFDIIGFVSAMIACPLLAVSTYRLFRTKDVSTGLIFLALAGLMAVCAVLGSERIGTQIAAAEKKSVAGVDTAETDAQIRELSHEHR